MNILRLIAGVIAGILMAGVFFFTNPSILGQNPQIKLGKLLDMDTIYLNKGKSVDCWILDENDEMFYVETENSMLTYPKSSCKYVSKDKLTKFLKKII